MDDILKNGLSKILLAGIGALGITSEKSKELFDQLVKKGELTVEQAKSMNEELKHNKEAQASAAAAEAKASAAAIAADAQPAEESAATILQKLDSLSADELAQIRAKLDELGNKE